MNLVTLFRNIVIVYFVNCILCVFFLCPAKKVRYISTEHPQVTYFNKKYTKYFNLTSQRYGRRDPVHYVGLYLETTVTIDHNLSVDFYLYEYLSNVYKRGFIEMHFDICDMIQNDKIIGAPLRQGKLAKPCSYPPGVYHMYNMSIDVRVIPPSFPFQKGRVYANLTATDTNEIWATGYIDMEVKERNI